MSGGQTNAETLDRDRWDALKAWGDDATRIERLTGGVANDVWLLRVGGELAVGRLGSRSDADLAWEAELLLHLDRQGLVVPVPLPTTDGRLFVDGLTVMTFIEGRPPESAADWRGAAAALRHLHDVTRGWPQRPGWRSSKDLLTAETGTKVDLRAMPAEGVARCRAAWARVAEHESEQQSGRESDKQCVVHGDSNNVGNVLVTRDGVALIDWDEAHVDTPALDLVLPHNAAGLEGEALDIASQASAAWEAAVCWDDDHAKRCLAEVRPL